ncbi:MAG: ATP-dependent Clp protease proteolytic subunit, partial [Pseudomonadota bacterium]
PTTWASGSAEDLRKSLNRLEAVKESLVASYHARTGVDSDEISRMMTDETWMLGPEAVRLGFADQLDAPVEMAAQVFNWPDVYNKVPAALIVNKQEGPLMTAEAKKTAKTTPEPENTQSDVAPVSTNVPDIDNSAIDTAAADAVKNERARVKEINAATMNGFESLAAKAIDDGLSPGDFALAQIKEQKSRGPQASLDNIQNESELVSSAPLGGQPTENQGGGLLAMTAAKYSNQTHTQ